MGAPLPKPDEELPEEYEIQISRLVAQASQQVLQANQMQAAQQQAQQQMQDPIIQMQMQELQIKGAEVERKKMKDAQDAQLKREQLAIEDKRIEVQAEIEGTKLGAKIEKDKEESQYKQELEGTRLGVEIARSKEKSMIELARIMKEGKKPKGE
jgi:5-methylthioribose kinase